MANQITSQREENFEDPLKFRPERWLSNCAKEDTDFSYLPFGYGVRSCLGKSMAEIKMMLLTAKVFTAKFNYIIVIVINWSRYSYFSWYDNSELNMIMLTSKAILWWWMYPISHFVSVSWIDISLYDNNQVLVTAKKRIDRDILCFLLLNQHFEYSEA